MPAMFPRLTVAQRIMCVAIFCTAASTHDARAQARPRAPRRAAVAPQPRDPRVGLRGGWKDAAEAASGMQLVAHRDRPAGFVNPESIGDFGLINTDMTFDGSRVFIGSYNGFQVWDISTPSAPTLRTSFICPGGQGDLSVRGSLLFMSVEETRGRVDCGTQGVAAPSSAERFLGVRIFDISDLDHPKQVAAVQTCRGSHTHTLVPDLKDPDVMYVYVSGTGGVRPATELAGCADGESPTDTATARFRIDVIRVPLAAPQDARIVNRPRVFADRTGRTIRGLWQGGSHGAGTQETAETDQCHDITAYPALGLAAGACSGNGILLDISNPANPKRVSEVIDPAFSYWHSATFNNAGDKVLFSDEWGGGVGARCQATDRKTWGADAIFTIAAGNKMIAQSHYKIPAAQTALENCVAHNGNLIPVPGRDIMVQAFYQGGLTVVDFTDPKKPFEIAYFDRGPIDTKELTLAGFWSGYWYNGHIYGSEIGRGLDVFQLTPSAFLSQNEIDAAKSIQLSWLNPQWQETLTWSASLTVARAYLDQLERGSGLPVDEITAINASLGMASQQTGTLAGATLQRLAERLEKRAPTARDARRVLALSKVLRSLAAVE
jgi:hypothetical protein